MYRPKEIAETLGISPATLRLWSNNFSDVLSPAAQKAQTETGTAAQRRYDDHDLAVFQRAQEYLNHGSTYEEALRRIKAEPVEEATEKELSSEATTEPLIEGTTVAVLTEEHPILLAFRHALEAKDETIRSLEARVGEITQHKDQTIETLNRELLTVQATKDETIAILSARVDDLSQSLLQAKTVEPAPAPVPASSTRFRWSWLNWFLQPAGDNPAHGDIRP